MRSDRIICDVCDINIGVGWKHPDGWTSIILGTKLNGSPDYEDLCPSCTLQLIHLLDNEKNNRDYNVAKI